MLAAAACLGAGLLPGRAALKQRGPVTLRVALQLQERAESAQSWASLYDLASEEVTIETASSTAGPLEAYETAEKPAQEGAVRATGERAALILLPDASGWQGEDVRALADRHAVPLQRAPPLSLPLPVSPAPAPDPSRPPSHPAPGLPSFAAAPSCCPTCCAPSRRALHRATARPTRHCMRTACALHAHCKRTACALHAHCTV